MVERFTGLFLCPKLLPICIDITKNISNFSNDFSNGLDKGIDKLSRFGFCPFNIFGQGIAVPIDHAEISLPSTKLQHGRFVCYRAHFGGKEVPEVV